VPQPLPSQPAATDCRPLHCHRLPHLLLPLALRKQKLRGQKHQMMSMINDTETVMAGALDCIVVAMMEHREHAGVQEEGCAVLVNLAYIDNQKIAIASSGGLVILLAAMTAHMG